MFHVHFHARNLYNIRLFCQMSSHFFAKIRSFALLCVSIVNVYQFMCVLLSHGSEGGVWDLIVFVPDHSLLPVYFCISALVIGLCGDP